MSGSEGKVLRQKIEQLPPWEVQHLFPLPRSIWSCCRFLVCLVLFRKVWCSPYLSGSGNTLMKNPAASLNLPFHTVPQSLLLTPSTTFHCRQLRPTSVTILSTVSEEARCLLLPLAMVLGTSFLTSGGPWAHSWSILKICPQVSLFLRGRGNLAVKWQQTPFYCNFRMKRQTVPSPSLNCSLESEKCL